MKVWITKYALTEGIREANAEVCKEISLSMISIDGGPGKMDQCFHGNDWHTNQKAAIKRAEEMRHAKIVSLKKSIAKMEKLNFNVCGGGID